jgi:hypothetical protein
MEPGVAECADGSLYLTLRTATGFLYEARSTDAAHTWQDLRSTGLVSPAAPSTVTRDPHSDDLWLFYCDRPGKSNWKQRSRQVLTISQDHGHTWSAPRPIEDDPKHSYGYISVTPVRNHVLLTYYDWHDQGQPGFHMTHLRARHIPTPWFRGYPIPPVFQKSPAPPPAQTRPATLPTLTPGDPKWPDLHDGEFHSLYPFCYRDFHLGLLHVLHPGSRVVQPEWVWSHNGQNWARTHTPCLALGDELGPDCRMVVVTRVTFTRDTIVCHHNGYGRDHENPTPAQATLSVELLDRWLATLPQP